MAIKPRSTGEFPLQKTIPMSREADARMKFHATRQAIPYTELARKLLSEGLARLDAAIHKEKAK